MHQRDQCREAEVNELQQSRETARFALAQNEAERIGQAEQVEQLARAYQQRAQTKGQITTTYPQEVVPNPILGCLRRLPQVF